MANSLKTLIAAALICSLAAVASAQRPHGHLHDISLSTYRQNADSTTTATFSLGLQSYADTLHGVAVNLFGTAAGHEMKGVGVGGFITAVFGNATGALIAPLSNNVTGTMRGLQLSAISNYAHSLRGAQVGGLYNISSTPMRGLQFSPATNISYGINHGMQLSLLTNISSGRTHGLQISSYNYADTLAGLQIGALNLSGVHSKGLQVGIVNYARDTAPAQIGLVKINPRTRIQAQLFAGTTSLANIAVRFLNGSAYTSLGTGYFYSGMSHHFSGELNYRMGRYIALSPRWALSGDIGVGHIESFEEHERSHPRRLFSIESRVNGEYRLNRYLGLIASAGYANVRHYHHASLYRNRLLLQGGVTMQWPRGGSPFNPKTPTAESDDSAADSLARWNDGRKNFLRAAAQVTGINVLVNSFDRFVMNEDFAKISLHSIKHNVRYGFVWDNDSFSTNLFSHPYHGNLYFNSARSNGLTFWESVPFAMGGSLMWEFCGEVEPAAINDVMATTMGGIALGEVTHRLSEMVLDDSKRGSSRFWRELAATVINPMGGLQRILSGQAWRVKADHNKYYDGKRYPIDLSVSVGSRYLSDDGALFRGEFNPYVNIFLEYGDPIHADDTKPYDFFYLETTVGLSANQPLINRLHLIGRLWGKNYETSGDMEIMAGLFQHFNYYDSKPVKDGTELTPYRISEAASLGPGVIINLPEHGVLTRLEQRLFLSGILLGGTKSDYYNVIDRDYNMGSGFSVKTKTHMEFRNFGRFILHANYYRLFTWKGYEHKDLEHTDPLYLNAQGDKSNASLAEVSPMWEFDFHNTISATLGSSYFMRVTRYSYHKTVRANTFEIKLGVTCHF